MKNKSLWRRIAVIVSVVWVGVILIASALTNNFHARYSSPGTTVVLLVVGVTVIVVVCLGVPWIAAAEPGTKQTEDARLAARTAAIGGELARLVWNEKKGEPFVVDPFMRDLLVIMADDLANPNGTVQWARFLTDFEARGERAALERVFAKARTAQAEAAAVGTANRAAQRRGDEAKL